MLTIQREFILTGRNELFLSCFDLVASRALAVIQNELMGKSLVAEMHARSGSTISLLLIDTFTEQDIVVNERLCEQLSMPSLERPLSSSGGGSSIAAPSPVSPSSENFVAVPVGGTGGTVTPTATHDRQMSPRNLSAEALASQDVYGMEKVHSINNHTILIREGEGRFPNKRTLHLICNPQFKNYVATLFFQFGALIL